MAKRKVDLKSVVKIESVDGPKYSKNNWGTKKYRTEGVGIAMYPNGNPSGADTGKVRIVCFETTDDEELDESKVAHFNVGDVLTISKGEYQKREDIDYRFRSYVPSTCVGQLLCDIKHVSINNAVEVKTAEEKVETFFLHEDKEKLEKDKEELEKQIADLEKQKETLNDLTEELNAKKEEISSTYEEIEELKRQKITVENETRKNAVDQLMELLHIENPHEITKIIIDVRDLRKGYDSAFLWK